MSSLKGYLQYDSRLDQESIVLKYINHRINYEIRISPFFGSNIYKFAHNGKDIFYCDYNLLKKREWTGCFILWPLPNRVRNKKFEFEGKTYDLTGITRKSGNYPLIHGLVDDKKWKIGKIAKNKKSITATTYIEVLPETEIFKFFPFKSRLTLKFTLSTSGLKVYYTIHNFSGKNLPFGFALHPYFPKYPNNKTSVIIPAKNVMESDKDLLPTGKLINVKSTKYDLNKKIPVASLSFDDVFTDLKKPKTAIIDFAEERLKLIIKTSGDFTHVVLYTKEKNFFCLENQTGSTDMINLHSKAVKTGNRKLKKTAHLLILKPGQKHSGFVEYKINKY